MNSLLGENFINFWHQINKINTKSRGLAAFLILETLEQMISRLRIDYVALLLLSGEEND